MRVALTGLALLFVALGCERDSADPIIVTAEPPVKWTKWPWPGSIESTPNKGITRWFVETEEKCTLELLRFDFTQNPSLRLEIYDQDEDDARPFDNVADYYPRGVGQVVRHLNDSGRGPVVAAWNGLFFAYDRSNNPPNGFAHHIGPVVLGGKAYHNVGRHRWMFGVKLENGKPKFKAIHQPPQPILEREFDFAADGAQCLVYEGKPLIIENRRNLTLKAPVPSSPAQAGHIPIVDHMRTSRTSMGWSEDSQIFYLLVVNEPDTENASKFALKHGEPLGPGWTLAHLQAFWLSLGVWGAVNSDGGAVTQMVFKRADGKYEMLPPRLAALNERLVFDDTFKNAPQGGSLMTFFVADRAPD